MQTITTIGLDIAKSVFQVHGIDAEGTIILRRQLKRRYVLVFFQKLPPCLVGIEACASSHYWCRELKALGHVKPYVKRQKNRTRADSKGPIESDLCFEIVDRIVPDDWHADLEGEGSAFIQLASDPCVER